MPEASYLARLREDIDRHSQQLKSVLRSERIRREFLKGVSNDEKKVVTAFVSQNQESALKTKPKVGSSALSRSIRLSQPPSSSPKHIKHGWFEYWG